MVSKAQNPNPIFYKIKSSLFTGSFFAMQVKFDKIWISEYGI